MKPLTLALLALFGALPASGHAELLHRWSFNVASGNPTAGTVFTDSVSGMPMTLRGVGAILDGTRIALPGTTTNGAPETTISAYLDLPNGVVSSKTNLTLEFWAAPLGGREWAPLCDFGRWNQA